MKTKMKYLLFGLGTLLIVFSGLLILLEKGSADERAGSMFFGCLFVFFSFLSEDWI